MTSTGEQTQFLQTQTYKQVEVTQNIYIPHFQHVEIWPALRWKEEPILNQERIHKPRTSA